MNSQQFANIFTAENSRISNLVIVGSNDVTQDMINEIVGKISELYGGLTYNKQVGMWAENGDQFTSKYDNIATEDAHTFQFCVTLADFDKERIMNCFKCVSDVATWIHWETFQSHAHHFNVKEL